MLCAIPERQTDDESRAFRLARFKGQGSPVFFHDYRVAYRQTLPAAFADASGREKGLKNATFHVFGNTGAGVRNTDFDGIVGQARADHDTAFVCRPVTGDGCKRLGGIDYEGQEHLPDIAAKTGNRGQRMIQIEIEFGHMFPLIAGNRYRAPDDGIDVFGSLRLRVPHVREILHGINGVKVMMFGNTLDTPGRAEMLNMQVRHILRCFSIR